MDFLSGSGCFTGKITFTCKEGSGIGAPVYASENCVYSFNWETQYACSVDGDGEDDGGGGGGSSGGLSIGSILSIIFFVSIFVYFAGGYVYRYQKYEARGVDAVPNLDFWRELPALVKDGCGFFLHKTQGFLIKTKTKQNKTKITKFF